MTRKEAQSIAATVRAALNEELGYKAFSTYHNEEKGAILVAVLDGEHEVITINYKDNQNVQICY
jgi:hypothetical protein